MKIYRYEHEDGGGPYCDFSGQSRDIPGIKSDDGYLYGCISLESLNNRFKNEPPEILKDCSLKIYEIPDNEVIIQKRQVLFPKKFSPHF